MTKGASASPQHSQTQAKARSFKFFESVPIIGETADPEAAGILAIFASLVSLTLVLVAVLLPHDSSAYGHVLQTAGGLVVLLGLYYTAGNLREARAEQFAGRLARILR